MVALVLEGPHPFPLWQCTYLVTRDLTVYVPLMYCPWGTRIGLQLVAQDGEWLEIYQLHPFVRLDWLVRRFPEDSIYWDSINKIVERETRRYRT